MTADDRRAALDVEQARANVRHAEPRYGRPPARGSRPATGDWLQGFVRRYGWRAYALPILALVTVAALMTSTSSGNSSPPSAGGPPAGASASVPPTADPRISLGKSDNKGALSDTVLRAAALPAGAAYTKVGKGSFRVLPGTTRKVGTGQLFRYSIDVENGVTGVDLTQFATMVDQTMDDPRSWSGHGVTVQRVDSGPHRLPRLAHLDDDRSQHLRVRHPGRDVVLLRAAGPGRVSTWPGGCGGHRPTSATCRPTAST